MVSQVVSHCSQIGHRRRQGGALWWRVISSIMAVLLLAAFSARAEAAEPSAASPQGREMEAEMRNANLLKIRRLTDDDKYKEAAELAAKLRRDAEADHDAKMSARALVAEVQARISLDGFETAAQMLLDAAVPGDPEARARIQLARASALLRYQSRYSWEIRRREKMAAEGKKPLKNWTQDEIVQAINAAFADLWAMRADLANMSFETFDDLIERNNFPVGIRPTLRDAVTYLWVDHLAFRGMWRASDQFSVFEVPVEVILGTGGQLNADSARLTDKSVHPLAKISALLSDLEAFHRAAGRREAELETRRMRFLTLSPVVTESQKKRLSDDYRQRLKGFEKEPWWSMAVCTLAENVRSDSRADALIDALALAKAGQDAFPNTPGGEKCRIIAEDIERPTFNFDVTSLDGPRKRSIEVKHKNVRQLFFRAYPFDFAAWRLKGRGHENLNKLTERIMATQRPVAAWTVSLTDPGDYRSHQTFVEPPLDVSGTYWIAASTDESFDRRRAAIPGRVFLLSRIALTQHTSESGSGQVEISVVDADNGAPIQGAQVEVFQRADSRWDAPFVSKGNARTNASGQVRMKLSGRERDWYAVAWHGEEMATNLDDFWNGFRDWNGEHQVRPHAAIYTDRAVYRPGQTVQWKLVPYKADMKNLKFSTVPRTRLLAVLFDANGQKLSTAKVTTNAFGSASGEFVLPEGRALGSWSIRVSQDQPRKNGRDEWIGSQYFRVEEYKRPTFEVSLEQPRDAVAFNAPVKLSGTAQALSGFQLTGGKAVWSVTRTPRYAWFPWSNWRSHSHSRRSSSPEVVAAGTSEIGAGGKFSIEFIPKMDPAEEALHPDDEWNYKVDVTVTDEGGETRTASLYLSVGWKPLLASIQLASELNSNRSVLMAGVDDEVVVKSRTRAGEPKRARGRYRIVRLDIPTGLLTPADISAIPWMDEADAESAKAAGLDKRFLLPGDSLRPRWSSFGANEALAFFGEGREAASGSLEYGDDGKAVIQLGNLPAGAYRLHCDVTDPATGKTSRARTQFIRVSGAPDVNLPLILSADKSTARVGESVRFVVHSGRKGQHLLWEVFRDEKRIEQKWMVAGTDAPVFERKIVPADRGGFTVRVTTVMDWQLVQSFRSISVPFDDRELVVKWLDVPETVEPGTKRTIRLNVSRADGQKILPGSAEVLGFIYDKSLDVFARPYLFSPLSLLPSRTGTDGFWDSLGRSSVSTYLDRRDERDHSRGDRSHYWFGSDRFKNLFMGYGRGMAKATKMRSSAKAVGGAPMANAAPMAKMAESAKAERLEEAERGPTFDADSAESEKAADASAVPPATIRQDFRETAMWIPAVQPKADGSVTLTFTVPDALTAWQVYAVALDKELRGGRADAVFRSARKLMVRPRLPRFLREGDKAELAVTVENSSDKPLEGTVDITIADVDSGRDVTAAYGLSGGSARQKFSAGAKKGTALTFPVQVPTGVGQIRVTVSAKTQDGLSDGEMRDIPVLPSRSHLSVSRFAALRGNESRTLSFELPAGDDTLIHEALNVTLDANLLSGVISAMPYLFETPFESISETVDKFTAANTLIGLYGKFPALGAMAKTHAAERKTLFKPFDGEDRNRRISLEETPWLRVAQGCCSVKDNTKDRRLQAILAPETAARVRDKALKTLRASQNSDGGFSWWKGGYSSAYMTLYVLDGLLESAWFGGEMPRNIADRAWRFIANWYKEEISPLMKPSDEWPEVSAAFTAYLCFVSTGFQAAQVPSLPEPEIRRMLDFTLQHQKTLSARGRGYLALSLHRMGRVDEAKKVFETVMSNAKTTDNEGTFWQPEARSWLWYQDTVSSHAFALRALTELNPKDPRRAGLAQWLFLNKKLDHWSSSRASAAAISALSRYAISEGWGTTDDRIRVTLGGKSEVRTFTPGKSAPEQRWLSLEPEKIDPAALSDIRLEQQTKGLMFASATWHYSTEKGSEAAAQGDLLAVERKYFRRVLKDGQWTLEPLNGTVSLKVGDEVEVQFTLTARHPAEFIHLRDPRAAGFEPVEAISGYRYDTGLYWRHEIRDSSSNFFIERLPAGEAKLRYRLRATMAGEYRLAPATLQSVYAPEFTAHSSGTSVRIGSGR